MRTNSIRLFATAALLLGLCLAPQALAKGKGKEHSKQHAVQGTIVKVDGNDVVISVKKGKETSEVTVTTDDATKVKIDGEDATVADLAPGMHVTVPAHEGIAKRIKATTQGAGKPAGDGDGEKHGKDKDHGHGHDH